MAPVCRAYITPLTLLRFPGSRITREGSKYPVLGVEKTREGSSSLKLSRSGVEKTREGSKYPVLEVEKTRQCALPQTFGFELEVLCFVAQKHRTMPGPMND